MNKKMKIAGVMGSLRGGKVPLEDMYGALDSEDISDEIYRIGSEKKLSNSEALLLAAMWGAKQEGAEVEIVKPGCTASFYQGVVFSTPVYFGNRSSVIDNFIRGSNLSGKAVGVVSCGAKRNGGQETANVFTLHRCMGSGAIVTGNGPPTGQYGGTGWAGNRGAIIDDDFGIKTSVGTGRRVARLARIMNTPVPDIDVNILRIVYGQSCTGYKEKHIDISLKHIKPCRACPVCPNGDLGSKYTCVIKDDDMEEIHSKIIEADCILVDTCDVGHSPQTFMERTRFIRRHHYELSDRLFCCRMWSGSGIRPLEFMSFALRHNMFVCSAVVSDRIKGTSLLDYTKQTKQARIDNKVDAEYTPVGYEDAGKGKEGAYRD